MPQNREDIIEWPDGHWCYAFELWEHSHKSDDFIIHPFESEAYNNFLDHHNVGTFQTND